MRTLGVAMGVAFQASQRPGLAPDTGVPSSQLRRHGGAGPDDQHRRRRLSSGHQSAGRGGQPDGSDSDAHPTDEFDCRAQVVRLDEDPDSGGSRVAAFRLVDLNIACEARIAEALAALSEDTDPTAVPMAWHSTDPHGGMAG